MDQNTTGGWDPSRPRNRRESSSIYGRFSESNSLNSGKTEANIAGNIENDRPIVFKAVTSW